MTDRAIDPSLLAAVQYMPNIDINAYWKVRALRALGSFMPSPSFSSEVTIKEVKVPTKGENAWIVKPRGPSTRARPMVVWIHGGGHIITSRTATRNKMAELALELDAVVVNPNYRLAPDHPFPADLDDNYSCMVWVNEHAEELGIDATKTIVGGDSAGGGLAAAVAQKARDEGFPLLLQVLNYPMLDDSTAMTGKEIDTRGIALWTPGSNYYAWKSYLGVEPGTSDNLPPYAVPARCKDLSGLAPAWIGCGKLDIFYNENVEYARRLKEAGVPVDFVHLEGAYHGFDMVNPNANLTRMWIGYMLAAMRKAISASK